MKIIKGRSVSPGIVSGKALLFNSQKEIILRENIDQKEKKLPGEIIDDLGWAIKHKGMDSESFRRGFLGNLEYHIAMHWKELICHLPLQR